MVSELEQKLKKRAIHPTAMRLLVLKKLQNAEHAFTLNDLEADFEHADKTTLYRTLKTFEKNKLVHSIDDGTGSMKYALCDETCDCLPEQAHVHFHCNDCGLTFCMKESNLPKIQLPKKFRAEETSLVVKGLCEKCS